MIRAMKILLAVLASLVAISANAQFPNKPLRLIVPMPEIRQKIAEQGADVIGGPPEAFAKHIAAEREKWSRVIRSANIVVN